MGVVGGVVLLGIIGAATTDPEVEDDLASPEATSTLVVPGTTEPESTFAIETAAPTQPTPAPTPPPTPRRPQPTTFTLSGAGQRATETFQLAGGVTVFRLTHQGAANFAIWLKSGTGEEVELLVNEIGAFNGSKLIGADAGTYLLDVSADGPWSVVVEQPRPVSAPAAPQTLTGGSQAAAGPIQLSSGLARFEMRHSGNANFAIWLYDDFGGQAALLVNEIGPFSGSKAENVDDGFYWFDVSANGDWSIAVTQ